MDFLQIISASKLKPYNVHIPASSLTSPLDYTYSFNVLEHDTFKSTDLKKQIISASVVLTITNLETKNQYQRYLGIIFKSTTKGIITCPRLQESVELPIPITLPIVRDVLPGKWSIEGSYADMRAAFTSNCEEDWFGPMQGFIGNRIVVDISASHLLLRIFTPQVKGYQFCVLKSTPFVNIRQSGQIQHFEKIGIEIAEAVETEEQRDASSSQESHIVNINNSS